MTCDDEIGRVHLRHQSHEIALQSQRRADGERDVPHAIEDIFDQRERRSHSHPKQGQQQQPEDGQRIPRELAPDAFNRAGTDPERVILEIAVGKRVSSNLFPRHPRADGEQDGAGRRQHAGGEPEPGAAWRGLRRRGGYAGGNGLRLALAHGSLSRVMGPFAGGETSVHERVARG